MIQNYFDNVKRFLGSLIPNAHVWAGWDKGIYLNGGCSPAKRAWRAGKKEGGLREGIFARSPVLGGGWDCRATGAALINYFVQNKFGFGHIIAPRFDFQEFGRPKPRRDTPRQRETLARRARRGSPSAGSKSLAILSICFAQ